MKLGFRRAQVPGVEHSVLHKLSVADDDLLPLMRLDILQCHNAGKVPVKPKQLLPLLRTRDLFRDLFTGLMREIAAQILAAKTVYDTALAVFNGIRKNADVYRILMKANYAEAMLKEITRIASSDLPEDPPLEQMRIAFLTGALFNIVRVWADAGMDQTPEQMADMYMEILREPIRPDQLSRAPTGEVP